jgi:hypothetical protein
MTPIAQRKCAPSRVAVPGRNTGFVSPSSSAKTSLPETAESGCANKVPLAGLFAAGPKTYESRAPASPA